MKPCFHAAARGGGKLRNVADERNAALARLLHDGAGERMLGLRFHGSRRAEKLFCCHRAEGNDIGDLGRTLCDRAGFVENNGVDLVQKLQTFGALDEDALLGGFAGADHDRHGRCQTQRAGARDHEHGDADGERKTHTLMPDEVPSKRRDERDGDDHGNENPADLVGKLGDRRF